MVPGFAHLLIIHYGNLLEHQEDVALHGMKQTHLLLWKPSSRYDHTAWAFDNKFWMFGRFRKSMQPSDNDILSFDPSHHRWTNQKCSGDIPSVYANNATAVIGDEVWLYSRYSLYGLNMHSLIWTLIETSVANSPIDYECTLTTATATQLVLHQDRHQNTWILDLESKSGRQYTSEKDHVRLSHQSCMGMNGNVIILGGIQYEQHYNIIFHVMLKPKSLQQFAMKILYQHHDVLPWKQHLPKKLIQLIDFPQAAGNACSNQPHPPTANK